MDDTEDRRAKQPRRPGPFEPKVHEALPAQRRVAREGHHVHRGAEVAARSVGRADVRLDALLEEGREPVDVVGPLLRSEVNNFE